MKEISWSRLMYALPGIERAPTSAEIRAEVRRRLHGLELRQAARAARRKRKQAGAAKAKAAEQVELFPQAAAR